MSQTLLPILILFLATISTGASAQLCGDEIRQAAGQLRAEYAQLRQLRKQRDAYVLENDRTLSAEEISDARDTAVTGMLRIQGQISETSARVGVLADQLIPVIEDRIEESSDPRRIQKLRAKIAKLNWIQEDAAQR